LFTETLIFLGALGVIFVELYYVKSDVGTLKGEIARIPVTLSTSLLDQANQLAKEGKVDQALGAVRLDGAAIGAASQKDIPADPSYFRNAIRSINLVQSSAKTPKDFDALHSARVTLAQYRSALIASPSLPKFPIMKPTATNHLKPSAGNVTFLDEGDQILDGSELPNGQDFYDVPPNNPNLITTSTKWFTNGSQTLDNMQWIGVTFIHVWVKYFGGRLDLHNIRFVGCPFEIVSNTNGDKLADAVAQTSPRLPLVISPLYTSSAYRETTDDP
jgi:hypothetical protein